MKNYLLWAWKHPLVRIEKYDQKKIKLTCNECIKRHGFDFCDKHKVCPYR
jgi:hypothetical protein